MLLRLGRGACLSHLAPDLLFLPICKVLDARMACIDGPVAWHVCGANTNITSCLEKESCSRELKSSETPHEPHLIPCDSKEMAHCSERGTWRVPVPASCSSLLHGVHWPLKLPKMWCSFSSVVLMREVKGSFRILSLMTPPTISSKKQNHQNVIY